MGKQSRWQRKPTVEKEGERDDEYQEIVGEILDDMTDWVTMTMLTWKSPSRINPITPIL